MVRDQMDCRAKDACDRTQSTVRLRWDRHQLDKASGSEVTTVLGSTGGRGLMC